MALLPAARQQRGNARRSGVDVDIRVDAKQVEKMVRGLRDVLSGPNMMIYMRAVMFPHLTREHKEVFASEQDPFGHQWLPLAEATEEIREAKGFPRDHPINHRTGELERYITGSPVATRVDPIGVSLFFPGRAPASSTLERKVRTAQIGREGGPSGQGTTPARPVLGVTWADMAFFLQSFTLWFATEMSIKTGRP